MDNVWQSLVSVYQVLLWAGIGQSVQRLSIGWTFRESKPSGGRDFPYTSRPELRPIQPPEKWVPVFSSGIKRPGRGVDHPFESSAEFKERVMVYLYSPPPLVFHDPFWGEFYLYRSFLIFWPDSNSVSFVADIRARQSLAVRFNISISDMERKTCRQTHRKLHPYKSPLLSWMNTPDFLSDNSVCGWNDIDLIIYTFNVCSSWRFWTLGARELWLWL
jgi:hypothetical protein